MEAYIVLIVIVAVLINISFIIMGSLREGMLARLISQGSLLVILAYWNPIHLKIMLSYPPEIFRGYIFVTFTLYIFTMLSFEVFQRQKDIYAILGFNHKVTENSSRIVVEETLSDLKIPFETRENFTLINGIDKIIYSKKNIIKINIGNLELKKKIKKGIKKRLSCQITLSSIILSLLAVSMFSFYLLEAVKLFLYIINLR